LLLLSGGLDSTIALSLMKEQNIELEAVHFTSLFCTCGGKEGGCGPARQAADKLNVKLNILAKGDDYLELVKNPKHGRGKNLNICIDCRIYSFKKAKELMEKIGADFIITGEVLNQRPMSQHRQTMLVIEKEAGLEGLVLRPLSALLLDETIPEKSGWINRKDFKNIEGRGRKSQLEYADENGLKDFACPAGGCLLTDPGFSKRLKDLMASKPDFQMSDIALLKYGRHFRLGQNAKLVVGRNETENNILRNFKKDGDFLLELKDFLGPVSLLTGSEAKSYLLVSGAITARYGDVADRESLVNISVFNGSEAGETIQTKPAKESEYNGVLI